MVMADGPESFPAQPTLVDGSPPEGWFYGTLFRPVETFNRPDLSGALGYGVAAIGLVAAIGGLALGPASPGKVVLAAVTLAGWQALIWLVITGMAYFVGSAIGPGRGDSGRAPELGGLMAANALSFLPFILIGPLVAASRMGQPGRLVAALGAVVVLGWWLRLLLAAVRGAMGLSTGRATLVLACTELMLAALPTTYLALWILSVVLLIG